MNNNEPTPLVIARRELERRTPFFSRLWELMEKTEREQMAATSPQAPPSHGASRKELAGLTPFFLRVWLLREHVAGEHFPNYGTDLHTLPLGSQYSDPLCDVGSSDIQLY